MLFRRENSRTETQSENYLGYQRRREIAQFVAAQLSRLPETERKELVDRTNQLYESSRDVVAPVITGFADHLLRQLTQDGGNHKIVFLARDGLGSYLAALGLLKKFPSRYPGVIKDQLVYAFFTRRTTSHSSSELLTEYVTQLGVRPNDGLTMADIGMYGSTIYPLHSKLPNRIIRTEYLISCTSEAAGFMHNSQDKEMKSLQHISGNPAVHFLEDTFSGPIQSPRSLVKINGVIKPDTAEQTYPPEISIRRQFALLGIEDFVKTLLSPEINIPKAIAKLDKFLGNEATLRTLMVPHE